MISHYLGATQNEISGDQAKNLIANGAEGANMPSSPSYCGIPSRHCYMVRPKLPMLVACRSALDEPYAFELTLKKSIIASSNHARYLHTPLPPPTNTTLAVIT